jgi:hypothetical protein
MNQIASAGGARNLLPSRTFNRGQEKDGDNGAGDGGLLKPTNAHESSRSPLNSRSASVHNSGSRKGSLVVDDNNDQNTKLSLIKRKEIKTIEDLEKEKRKREKGEEYV